MDAGQTGRDGAGVKCEPATFYIKLHIIRQETLHVLINNLTMYTGEKY